MKAITCAIILIFTTVILAQSNVNPDISLIGTFNTKI